MPHTIGIDARKLFEPGIGSYVQNLVRGLAELDADNEYVLFIGARYAGEFEDLPSSFRTVVERSPVYSFRERLALSWRQLREGLDLYHATHYILPLWLPRRTVTTVHDILHLLNADFMSGRLARILAPAQLRLTLARSDRILAESTNAKEDLVEYFDVRAAKVVAVYPGVDAHFVPGPVPGDERALEILDVPPGYVLFRGDTRRHKNEERVLRAFASACASSGSEARLLGIGPRELSPERFAALVDELGLAERVRWLDSVIEDRLPAVLRGAELFLYPTLYEGFPQPVAEALACGVPVVTSNRATVREVAEGSAKLVEPSSVESLAGAIGWCLSDPELRRHLASDALKRAEEFRWRRVAERTLAVYEEALAGSGERRRLLGRRGASA
jgi:glycosyltransferase involved in cell wall biosynthesis